MSSVRPLLHRLIAQLRGRDTAMPFIQHSLCAVNIH